METLPTDDVCAAYDPLAAAYDLLTRAYCHDRWLDELERLALRAGLRGRRVLDVGCGTGKSFLPLLARGYDVTACDISPAMAAIAADKAPEANVLVADMRELPDLGRFDLVTCLDDALNYLLDDADVAAALAGIRRALAPGGVALWDVNTLASYRSAFTADWVVDEPGTFVAWRGLGSPELLPGGESVAQVEVFLEAEQGWERRTAVHRQRHWPVARLRALAAGAGLRIVGVHGQHRGAVIEPHAHELAHAKIVFVARPEEVKA